VSTDCTRDKQSYTGIRCQYHNLDQSLSSYKIAIAIYYNHPPSGVALATWQGVLKQILTEPDDSADVRKLYGNINNFYLASFLSKSVVVDQLISDAQIESGQKVSGSSVFIFLEIIQTAIGGIAGPATGEIDGSPQ
jgi:hypothetical protein